MDLQAQQKVVGLKQSRKAIEDGMAHMCYVAYDADGNIRRSLVQLCMTKEVQVDQGHSKKELGIACGIDVDAAVVTILK